MQMQSDIPLTYSQDTGKPSVEEVTVQSVPNRNNDIIEVEFTEPMEESSAKNLANYVFENGTPSKSVPLTTGNATIKLSADLKKATITLKGIDLQTGSAFSLQVSNIIDLTGEMLDTEKRTGKVTGDLTAPFLKSVSGSTSDTQDIVIVHFSEAVKKDSAEKIENYTIESPIGNDISTKLPAGIIPKLTYTETDTNNDGAVDEFTVEIKYTKSKPTLLLESGGTVKVSASDVVDLAGKKMVSVTTAEGTVSDGVAPTITSIKGKTVQDKPLQSGLDEIHVGFSENVTETTAEDPANYKLEVAESDVPLSNLKAVEDIKYDANTKTVTLYLDTSNKKNGHDADDYALKNSQSIKVTVTNVKDAEGNTIVAPDNWKEGSVNGETESATIVPTSVKVTGANTVQMTWNEELDATTLQVTDFELKGPASENYQITAAKIAETKKIVILTTKLAIPIEVVGLQLFSGSGIQLKDLAGNRVSTVTGESVTALGTEASYSLTGASVAVAPTKYISIGKNRQISDLFKLTAGSTANGEGFTVNTISFNVKTTARVLEKVQLMWSTDAKVGNSDDVIVSTPETKVGNEQLVFEGINKEISSAGDGYFYVLADISFSGKVTVDLLKGATATATQTKFQVVSTGLVSGEEIIIDTTPPVLTFKESTSSTEIVVKIEDESPLADASSELKLNPATNYNTLFEIVGVAAGTKIVSATYKANQDFTDQTFTLITSAGLPTDGFIRLKTGELIDMAGNPLAATFIAQGNGTNNLFVNPYELNKDEADFIGDIIQHKLEPGDVTYGPYRSDAKKVNGNVEIKSTQAGKITLQNLNIITGNLTINAPNASVVIGENVTVGGTLKIQDVSSAGVMNNGSLKDIEITDQDTTFINNGGITGKVDINVSTTTNPVKLGGTIPTVNVLKPAKLQVESGATIHTLTVNKPIEVTVTNNGAITTLEGDGIAFVNGTDAAGYNGDIHANTALAAINRASTVAAIGEALIKYSAATALGLDLTEYKKLGVTYQTAVHTAVYNLGNDYTFISDIKMVFGNVVISQKAQADVDQEAQKVDKILLVTTNGKKTLPNVSAGYELEVKTSSNEAVYDITGIGIKAGTSTVVYTVKHKASGKTAVTGNITVNVTPAVTGVTATFKVAQQGTAEIAAKAPAPVNLAGLTFTAPAGDTLNGYKFSLGNIADGTDAAATLSGKIVTIAGDFSNNDSAGTYVDATAIRDKIQSIPNFGSVTVSGTAVVPAGVSESAEFTGGVALVPATTEIFTITVTAAGGGVTAGTVRFTVGGLTYDVLVTDGMTVDAIASALNTKMTSVSGYTASVSTNVVTLTATTLGNQADLTGSISNR